MVAQGFSVDNTANNLANSNTVGFKRNQVDFQDLIYSSIRQPGTEILQGQQVPVGLQLGLGVRVSGNSKIFAQGSLQNTSNPLDVAIEGEGFFQITYPDGTFRYTRAGNFNLNASGQLVTDDGFLLTPSITIPPDAVSIAIGTDGTVSVVTAAAPNVTTAVGQIMLARFPNPAGLSAQGRNLFTETMASGAPLIGQPSMVGMGMLRQGFLETSNVEAVTELVNLIKAQRAYEFNSRAIRVADDMLRDTANQLVP